MDAKLTLSFDQNVISAAKNFAQSKGISLSRLTEILLQKATSGNYETLEDFPIADWVHQLSEAPAEYKIRRKTRKELKTEFFESRK